MKSFFILTPPTRETKKNRTPGRVHGRVLRAGHARFYSDGQAAAFKTSAFLAGGSLLSDLGVGSGVGVAEDVATGTV
jgi:hypothetical protein